MAQGAQVSPDVRGKQASPHRWQRALARALGVDPLTVLRALLTGQIP
jgi:hypothetical protein